MDLHERGKNSTHMIERRSRMLTDEDVEALADALHRRAGDHVAACRFARVTPERLDRAIEFCDRMDKIIDDSASLVGKTVLILVVTAIVGTLFAGFLVKIKDSFKVPLS